MNRIAFTVLLTSALALPMTTTARADTLGGLPEPQTLLVIEPSKAYPRNSEGDVVELKDGRLALVYTRFTGGRSDASKADLCIRTSSDAGKTWTDDRILVPNEGKDNVMSVSIVRLESGELLLGYLRKDGWDQCNFYVRRSTDELKTVGPPVRATTVDGYHVVNNDRMIQLDGGRLLVPAALHPCPDGTRKSWSGNAVPRTYYSDDGGKTWHADKTTIDPPPYRNVTLQEPGVVELRGGKVWMWMRTRQGSQYACTSTDRGVSWTEPKPTNLYSPCSPATIERIPWTGDLLCVYNDHSGRHVYPKGRRTPLCVTISTDEGKTWSPSRVIEPHPDGWYCYISMTFVGDRCILSYCAGDKQVGGLNRLKVLALPKGWLTMEK